MTPLEFLRAVWPDEGYYVIGTPFPTGGMRHLVFTSIEAAAQKAEELADKNIYFWTHTGREERVWNEKHHYHKTEKKWVPGWSVRLQSNAKVGRAFFFDLDCGADDETHYPTREDAGNELKAFCKAIGLPRPMMTSSGGGIHVYWLLDRPVASNTEWFQRASWLRQLAKAHGLRIDPSRTTDTASVLRVVGTKNIKPGRAPKPVTLICATQSLTVEVLDSILLAALEAAGLQPDERVNNVAPGLPSNLTATYDGAAPSIRSLFAVCPQARRLARSGGCVPEPQWWKGIIGVFQYIKDGEQWTHRISSGKYKGYSHEECQGRIERWREKTDGPAKCSTIEEVCGALGSICRACPNRKQNSNPILLARTNEKSEPLQVQQVTPVGEVIDVTIPAAPTPFRWGKEGGIEMLRETDEGKQYVQTVYPYTLYPINRSYSRGTETELQVWRAHLPHDTIRDFPVEAATLVDPKLLRARLANNGVYAEDFPALSQFMSAYIRKMLADQPIDSQFDHLGWNATRSKFILPDRMFCDDGRVLPTSVSTAAKSTRDFIGKKGSFQAQVDALHFYDNDAYLPLQFAIMAGLGSPLFYATGQHGAIVNLTGQSGASKSSALYTVGSFWGPPDQYAFNPLKSGASFLARAMYVELLSNLPFCLDEITLMEPEEAKQFAFWISQVGGRTTLDHTRKMRSDINKSRSLVAITTSNKSLHAMLSMTANGTTAAMMRVFEIDVQRQSIHRGPEADAYLRILRENHGWVGEKMAEVCVRSRIVFEKKIVELQHTLDAKYNMRADERFWFDVAIIVYVTTRIANSLGIVIWDANKLLAWALDTQLPRLRSSVADEAIVIEPIIILTDYLERINGATIKTSTNQINNLSSSLDNMHGQLAAHYDQTARTIWVLRDGFRRYCAERGVYMRTVVSNLMDRGIVTADMARHTLGLGTAQAKARSLCFTVDAAHVDLAQITPKLQTGGQLTVIQGGKAVP